jgi:hypothetical protein
MKYKNILHKEVYNMFSTTEQFLHSGALSEINISKPPT